jgi:choline dehydrogenase-like flavoprotein
VSGRAFIPRFRNVVDKDPRFIRGYGIDANMQGMAFGESPQAFFGWVAAMGEMLPRADNRVVLDPTVKDAWGLPVARVDCTAGENDRAMIVDMKEQIAALSAALGFEPLDPAEPVKVSVPGGSIHEVGAARMGNDRKTSYLDPHNQAWEVHNLYVVDGSAFPTIAWQNSTLTMMALALRAARHIVAEGRRQNIR